MFTCAHVYVHIGMSTSALAPTLAPAPVRVRVHAQVRAHLRVHARLRAAMRTDAVCAARPLLSTSGSPGVSGLVVSRVVAAPLTGAPRLARAFASGGAGPRYVYYYYFILMMMMMIIVIIV